MNDTPAEYAELVSAEQVRLSYSQTMTGVVGGGVAGGLLVWIFWTELGHTLLIGWLGCLWFTYGGRYGAKFFYDRRPDDRRTQFWSNLFVGLNIATGLVWAVAWLTFIPLPDPTYTLIVALWMIGLSSISVTAYAAHMPSLLSFTVPVLVPGAIQMFVIGDRMSVGVGIATCVGSVIVFSAWRRINKAMVKSIRLNFALEAEVAHRKKIEQRLHALSIEDQLTDWRTDVDSTRSWKRSCDEHDGSPNPFPSSCSTSTTSSHSTITTATSPAMTACGASAKP